MLYRFDTSPADLRVILFLGSGFWFSIGFFTYPYAIFSFALQFDTLFIGLGVSIVVGFWSSLGLTLGVFFFFFQLHFMYLFFADQLKE